MLSCQSQFAADPATAELAVGQLRVARAAAEVPAAGVRLFRMVRNSVGTAWLAGMLALQPLPATARC